MNTQVLLTEIEKRGYPPKSPEDLGFNISKLETRLRAMLEGRFNPDGSIQATYKEIGKRFGISSSRARALVEKALWVVAGKPETESESYRWGQ